MYRRKDLKEVTDIRTIPGESVTTQHKVVVGRFCFGVRKGKRGKKSAPKVRWWKLKEEQLRDTFAGAVRDRLGTTFPLDWTTTSRMVSDVAKEVLGETSGKGKSDRETWWWNEEVRQAIREKKEAKKRMDKDKNERTSKEYKTAKKSAKRQVAKAKSEACSKLYGDLETKEGQKNIFKVAKQRDKETKDIHHIKRIKDKNGVVIGKENEIRERWKSYYEKLMNEENPRERREEEMHPNNQPV